MYYEMIIIWTWRGYEKFSPSLGPKKKKELDLLLIILSWAWPQLENFLLYSTWKSIHHAASQKLHLNTHTHTQCKGGLFVSFLLFRLFLFSLLVIFFPPPDFLTGNSNLAENLYIEQLCRKSGGKLCNVMCPGKWAKADWQLDEYALVGLNVT